MRKTLFPALIICAALIGNVSAQKHTHEKEKETNEADRPATDAHSFMELFTKLERDWLLAIQHKDKQALDNILAPEFILRSAGDPEHLVRRADWMEQALNNWEIRSFSDRSMAIRAFAAEAVVSFVHREQATFNGKDATGDYFVVDLWIVNQGKWQVAARYVSPAQQEVAVRGKHL